MRVCRGLFRPSQLAPKSFSKLSTYKLIGSIPLSIQYRRAALLHFSNKFTVCFRPWNIIDDDSVHTRRGGCRRGKAGLYGIRFRTRILEIRLSEALFLINFWSEGEAKTKQGSSSRVILFSSLLISRRMYYFPNKNRASGNVNIIIFL